MRTVFCSLALLLLIAGCSKNSHFPTYDMSIDDTVEHDKDLQIYFIDLTDSRCPVGYDCNLPGTVHISLNLIFHKDLIHPLQMEWPLGNTMVIDTTVLGYNLKWLEVLPEENTGVPKEEYVIRLMVGEVD